MYRVTIYNGNTSTVIHEPSDDPNDAHLYECELVQGASGEIDSLSFTILPNNPGYESLNTYTTFIEVVDLRSRGEASIFSGRVLSVSPQMEEQGLVYKNIVCEDRLGYLNDSIQPYTPMNTYTVKEFLTLLLNNHNAQVEDYKKVYVGEVSFETSSGNVTKSLNYQTTWEAITGKLLELGGEIQLYSYNGNLYLDYVTELGSMGSQTIEIAKNMRSLQQDKSPTDIITRLIPLGDYLEEQEGESDDRERLTIASVNGGRTYIDDDDAIDAYGIIEGTVIWEDVTIASNLLEKGQQWLKDQTVNETVSLSAYDLYAAGIDPNVIERYNYYLTVNPLIGVNKYYRVAQKKINVIDPTDVTFTMGDQSTSLSASVKRTGQDAADAAAAINANLSKTVASLIAGNAIIVSLQASTADIYSLLAGNIGTGELEVIHLTAENTVIDEGVIINALMENATIGNLIAGKIFTDFIEIMDNDTDQNLYITGSVIQFKDEDGVVRMQMGLDASGNWNYYILDADGNTIFDALGLTEDGLIGNGAIIRDIAVADDAAIAGYKIDMVTLTECINEYGGLVMDASQVIIDGERLDYELSRIVQEVDGLSFEGLVDWKLYFAKNTSDTVPPEDDYYYGAICGIAICGLSVCGEVTGSGIWSTEEPTAEITEDGYIEYVWARYWMEKVDGTVEWGEPFLLSDSELRKRTSTMQTELSVVQGVIDARVWETYTDTAISGLESTVGDIWAEIRVELESITSTVAKMETTYDGEIASMTTDLAEIKETSGEISLMVESLSQEVEKNASDIEGAIAKIDMLPERITISATNASLGNSAIISLEVDGTVTTDALLDLREVRQAFADDHTAITISAGAIGFEGNTFMVESTYFRVTEDGHIYATRGTIGGWEIDATSLYNGTSSMSSTTNGTYLGATSGIRQYKDGDYINITGAVLTNGNSSNDKAELTEGALKLTHSGTYLGNHGTAYYREEPTKYGLTIDAEYECNYIGFARKVTASATTYNWSLLFNYGLDSGKVGYSETIIFFDSVRCASGLHASGININTISPLDSDYINIGLTASSVSIGRSSTTVEICGETAATQPWVLEQIPDVSGYATTEALNNLSSDLNSFESTVSSTYATTSDLNNYALKSEIPDVSGFITSDASATITLKTSDASASGEFSFGSGAEIDISELVGGGGGSGTDFTADKYSVTERNDAYIYLGYLDGLGFGLTYVVSSQEYNVLCEMGATILLGNDEQQMQIQGSDVHIGTLNSACEFIEIGNKNAVVYIKSSEYNDSDSRLKTSIQPLNTSSLDNLTPVSFKWRDGDDKTHYGYIAQEVQPYFPELVSEGADGMLGLAYTELIPLLHLEIINLKQEIAKLKGA